MNGIIRRTALIGLCLAAPAAAQDAPASDPAPPIVVSRTPRLADVSVNPALSQLRVVFDQDMGKPASWTGGAPSFPTPTGAGHWLDPRAFVLPVALEPGRSYCAGINGGRFWKFQSVGGTPAAQDYLLFRTSGGEPIRTLLPEENQVAIEELRRAVDAQYSHRDRLGLDWDALFEQHRSRLEAATNALEFMVAARDLLAPTDDQHISLQFEDAILPIPSRAPDAVFSQRAVAKSLTDGQKVNNAVIMGRFSDGIGYIMITSWRKLAAPDLEVLDQVLDILMDKDIPALIIDLRPNGGGDEAIAQHFAGRFVSEETPYAKHRTVDPSSPDGFSEEQIRAFAPNTDGPQFTKPVAVLMGGYNMSSSESFLLMMRQVEECTLVGDRSYGSSGNPMPHRLSNGVTVMLPSWVETDIEGRPIEGLGIEPDVFVKTDAMELRQLATDPVIQVALDVLRVAKRTQQ